MTNAFYIFCLVFTLIGLVGVTVALVIKLILFRKKKDVFRFLLKGLLLGEIVGIIILFISYIIFKKTIDKMQEPEVILTIPFYSMLVGLITMTLLKYFKRSKSLSI
jgi:NAD/NADP transhydrogenase beta subunit